MKQIFILATLCFALTLFAAHQAIAVDVDTLTMKVAFEKDNPTDDHQHHSLDTHAVHLDEIKKHPDKAKLKQQKKNADHQDKEQKEPSYYDDIMDFLH